MDLFEYQAKELFAKHGVPVTPGAVAYSVADARRAAEQFGGTVVVKAQVKTGGRGKAGGVKLADYARRQPRQRPGRSSASTSRATSSQGLLITPASDIAEEYYVSFLLDRANRTYLAMASVEGGIDIEEVAAHQAGRAGQGSGRCPRRRRRGQGRRDRRRGEVSLRMSLTRSSTSCRSCGTSFVEEDATLVEVNPLVKTPQGQILALDGKVTLDENADFRHPDHADLSTTTETDPLELRGQGEGSQLRQARRRGRHHRKRCRAGHVHPRRGGLRGRAVRWRQASELPRHRRRRSAQVMANGLEIILSDPQVKAVFVNVFGGITACDAVANGIVQAFAMLGERGDAVDQAARRAASTATTPKRVVASSTRPNTASSNSSTPWTPRPAASPNSPRGEVGAIAMSIFLNSDSQILVQGITGSEGTKHTRRMVASGAISRGRRDPRQGRSETSMAAASRCSTRLPRPLRRRARMSRWSLCRRGSPRPRSSRPSTREFPLCRCHHRRRSGQRHR